MDLSYSTLLNSDPEFPDFSKQRNFFVRWNHLRGPEGQPDRPLQRERERGYQPELHEQLQQQHGRLPEQHLPEQHQLDAPLDRETVQPQRPTRGMRRTP